MDPMRIGEFLWKALPDGPEKYQAYLCSREWSELKQQVLARADGLCERCRLNPPEAVHHLTYIRKYEERLEDLAAWCKACHEFTHGLSDHDPAKVHSDNLLLDRPLTIDGPEDFDGRTVVVCPYCGSMNCHMGDPVQVEPEGNQGTLVVPMSCEGPHEWEMVFVGHKGTLVAFTRNCRRMDEERDVHERKIA